MYRIFDRYDYDAASVLGIGGMGTVYRGKDTLTNQWVAIKHLKPEIVKTHSALVERFRREGEALRELNHPNIVKMLEAGKCENDHYLVMEFVPSGSLRDLLDKTPRLIVQRALYIALDLADALTRAHRLNILHRDIKPANVLLAEDGTPRLTDFGVARTGTSDMTQAGQLVGTLAYISPEALMGEKLDERHDIWAFGVMLFEMLAGERPFKSDLVAPLITEITTQPIPDLQALRPDVPLALVDLIYRMLQRNPENRIRSVRMVGAELEEIIHSGGSRLPAVIPTTQARFVGSTPTSQLNAQPRTPTPSSMVPRGANRVVNFPAMPTPFVGRERELAALSTLIEDPSKRLITLVGAGGVGKTRVAMQAAQAAAALFADGVYFVPLSALEKPELVTTRVAEVLEFAFSGTRDPEEELVEYMQDKRMLLVLDNMEHLVAGAAVLAEGLTYMPYVKMLVTSRERLRLSGEHVYELDSMSVPRADLPLQELHHQPSVMLFMSGANRVSADFKLDEHTAPAVVKTIQLVQGMPLGIELAAGWLEMLPIDEIAQEIEKSLDFLETDMRDMPERHRSIRAVFEYSWNLMSQEEKDAFKRLSLFRGGFERNAAHEVMATSLRTLTALVNKSVLYRQADGRYHVAKLLRQYAQEQFSKDPNAPQFYEAYVSYYATLIEQLRYKFDSKQGVKALQIVEDELPNLRHAWQIGMEQRLMPQLERMSTPLLSYYLARSMFAESIVNFGEYERLLAGMGLTHTRDYWRALNAQALILGRIGNYIESQKISEEALALARKLQDPQAIGSELNNMLYASMMRGRFDEGRIYGEEALEIGLELRNDYMNGITRGNLAYLEFMAGNLNKARQMFETLLHQEYHEEKSPIGYAFGNNNLGEIVQAQGNYEQAQKLYQIAYDTFKTYQHRRGMAFTTNNLAGIHAIKNEYEQAQALYSKAYALNKEIGDLAGLGHSLSALANIAMFEQNFAESNRYFLQVLELRRRNGDHVLATRTLTEVGMTYYMMGEYEKCIPYYEEAYEIALQLGNPMLISLAALGKGGIALYLQDAPSGMSYLREAIIADAQDLHTLDINLMFTLTAVTMILQERGYNDKAAIIAGFLEQQPVTTEIEFLGRPMLSNVMKNIEAALGKGYAAAVKKGRSYTIEQILAQVVVA